MKNNTFYLLTALSITLASYQMVNASPTSYERAVAADRILLESSNVNVAITPLGAVPDQNKITLHKGDDLTIRGTVTPDLGYNFESVQVVAEDKDKKFPNIPIVNPAVLKLKSKDRQTDPNFSFRYQAQEKGTSTVKLTATWKKENDKKTVDTSIEVNVED